MVIEKQVSLRGPKTANAERNIRTIVFNVFTKQHQCGKGKFALPGEKSKVSR